VHGSDLRAVVAPLLALTAGLAVAGFRVRRRRLALSATAVSALVQGCGIPARRAPRSASRKPYMLPSIYGADCGVERELAYDHGHVERLFIGTRAPQKQRAVGLEDERAVATAPKSGSCSTAF